ncbi:DUF1761 domain-containing protein [Rhodobacter sp. KR11]|jgi:hypothetical protein|uniref:DUF1761 domain-containing protein n=1 Tax=Rhodobacter sp. KR11 TaxID=2974588 RepID=UPI0022214E28|nr:DUF1761 domain-containing protein [Rhodobacter sp. KR11]MCW1918963.1 DUF1761 domain-containing protein [Rhodobacter sp. KR11]
MQYLAVLLAAAAAYGFAAFWYTKMSLPWAQAAGIPIVAGKPQGGGSPLAFVIGGAMQLLVAGMMRHVFLMSGLDTLTEGLMGGFGIGAFLITPWVAMNYAFAGRPFRLTLLDGVNSVAGCTLMGVVLSLFL